MPVVINDFEMVDEPSPNKSPENKQAQTDQNNQPATACVDPRSIEYAVRQQKERLARVRAQ